MLAIEPGHPGPLPDKTLYEHSEAAKQYPRAARRADLAYQGVPEMLLPHKKKRGKAGQKAKELTPQQKAENRFAASQRVPVEHGVRRCKAWRVLRDELPVGARAVRAGGDGDSGLGTSGPTLPRILSAPAGDGAARYIDTEPPATLIRMNLSYFTEYLLVLVWPSISQETA